MATGWSATAAAPGYEFDGTMPRAVLESYLTRAITMMGLLTGRGDVDDNIRMLTNIGVKFAAIASAGTTPTAPATPSPTASTRKTPSKPSGPKTGSAMTRKEARGR